MKKTLLATSLLIALAMSTTVSNAFEWGNWNPMNWGSYQNCQKVSKKPACKCKCKTNKCKKPCDACKREMEKSCPCQQQTMPVRPCDKVQNAED